MKTQRTTRLAWIIQVEQDTGRGRAQKTYLHDLDSDWGPRYMPYPYLEGAMEFTSYSDVDWWLQQNSRSLGGWKLKPVVVEVKTTYKLQ